VFFPSPQIFFKVGPLEFHYYGLMYFLSFLFSYYFLPIILNLRGIKIKKNIYENLFFYTFLGAIIGGRLFYIVFYNLSFYLENPIKTLFIWEGGLASHGGFLGASFVLFFLSKYYKIPFWKLTDSTVIPIGICLMLGRLGNFINGELYGRPTNVPWCMYFTDSLECRHPSQVYAMIKNLFLFLIFFSLRKTKFKDGTLSILFLFLYGIFRFIVEFFREPDPQLGLIFLNLTEGQIWSLVMIFISFFFFKKL